VTPCLLTVQECANILRCRKEHVYSLIKQGLLPGFRDSRRILIDEASITSYLEKRRVSGSHLSPPGTI